MALPYPEQTAGWTDAGEIGRYNSVLSQTDKVIYTSEEYSPKCFAVRNAYMVQHATLLVAYQYRRRSGAAQTVNMAKKAGIQIINLAADSS